MKNEKMTASMQVRWSPVSSQPRTADMAISAAVALSKPKAPVLMHGNATERHPWYTAMSREFV